MTTPDWQFDDKADAALVQRIVEAAPELVDSYTEYWADHNELLPYIYLPNAIRAFAARMRAGELTVNSCTNLAQVIEEALAEGGSVRNLALLGLIEEIAADHLMSRLHGQESLLDFMRDTLGDLTREAISKDLADSPLASITQSNN